MVKVLSYFISTIYICLYFSLFIYLSIFISILLSIHIFISICLSSYSIIFISFFCLSSRSYIRLVIYLSILSEIVLNSAETIFCVEYPYNPKCCSQYPLWALLIWVLILNVFFYFSFRTHKHRNRNSLPNIYNFKNSLVSS